MLRAWMKAFFLLVALVVSEGCHFPRNFDAATYRKADGIYLVTVSGKRQISTHDLLPLITYTQKTEVTSMTFRLPRIEGRVDGSELSPSPDYYYVGSITFSGNRMTVDLIHHEVLAKVSHTLSWNGKYTLTEKTSTQ